MRSSPRTRGWSLLRAAHPDRVGVVPADAGVVRQLHAHLVGGVGRPRGRGGGPALRVIEWYEGMSSPRTRGWSHCAPRLVSTQSVVPADAGVVPASTGRAAAGDGRPRGRGGGPSAAVELWTSIRSSPRTRGWSRPPRPLAHRRRVVPADAGVVPRRSGTSRRRAGRPRGRGGGPSARRSRAITAPSSPRTRGWSMTKRWEEYRNSVVPADAGVVLP